MVMCILGQEYWVCLMLLDCGNFKLSFACCVIFVDSKWFCTFSYCASFKYRMTYADRCERAVGSMGYSFCCSSLCCAFCSLLKGQCVFQGVRDPLIFVQFFIFWQSFALFFLCISLYFLQKGICRFWGLSFLSVRLLCCFLCLSGLICYFSSFCDVLWV